MNNKYQYQEFCTNIPSDCHINDVSWSNSTVDSNIVAIALDNSINFYNEEGDVLQCLDEFNINNNNNNNNNNENNQIKISPSIDMEMKSANMIISDVNSIYSNDNNNNNINNGEIIIRNQNPHDASSREFLQPHQPLVLEWHPKQQILASGWNDGGVCLWNESERILKEDTMVHQNQVIFIKWTKDGKRLITCDDNGLVAIWRGDNMRLKLICKLPKLHAPIQHISFMNTFSHGKKTTYSFYMTDNEGHLYIAYDTGRCNVIQSIHMNILFMEYFHDQDCIVMIGEDVVLRKYNLINNEYKETRNIKLSIRGDGSDLRLTSIGHHLIVAANKESMLRVWSYDSDITYHINLVASTTNHANGDFTSVTFDENRNILFAGTTTGRIFVWQYSGCRNPKHNEDDWTLLPSPPILNQQKSIEKLYVCKNTKNRSNIGVVMSSYFSILGELILNAQSYYPTTALQIATSRILFHTPPNKTRSIDTNVRIKGIHMTSQQLIAWDYQQIDLYHLDNGNVTYTTSIKSRATICCLHTNSQMELIFHTLPNRIEAISYQGVVMETLTFTENEGQPILLDICNNSLIVATDNNIIKLWDISHSKPKIILPGKKIDEITNIHSIYCNSIGNKIAYIAKENEIDVGSHDELVLNNNNNNNVSSNIYIYDVDTDRIHIYQFESNFRVQRICWDKKEDMILAVEVYDIINNKLYIKIMFMTSEDGILLQDTINIENNQNLLEISVPYIIYRAAENRVKQITLRDFIGLEKVTDDVKQNLLKFSYYLTIGNMDEAYSAVKNINTKSVWENMAKICVKTQRIDVAHICLSHMGHAQGARIINKLKKQNKCDTIILANIAIQLKMYDEAAKLYESGEHWSYLIEFCRDRNEWIRAIELCSKYDRVRLKTLHYEYAKHLEIINNIPDAIRNYEKSGAHSTEVPRMLYNGRIKELEDYIRASPNDNSLICWWAQYCEGIQNYEEAIKWYKKANDILSLVRIYCYMDQIDNATNAIENTNNKAAIFLLAREYERRNLINKAIETYYKCQCYNHGVRLAREHNMHNELMNLALECNDNPYIQLDAAIYFENEQEYNKAVLLYQKSGNLARGLQLCFKYELFDSLRNIAEDIGNHTNVDPIALSQCAKYFIEHNHFEKAVPLLIASNQHNEALQLCIQNNVIMNDTLATKLTPPKPSKEDIKAKEIRLQQLRNLGELCRSQRNYQLACRAFTQAGDKIEAIKCLLRSGDTEKIIYYATKVRKAPIYILVANYLQSLDWHNKVDIMQKIIKFYTKAHAWEQLANYYELCGVNMIDEFRDYEKSLSFMNESMKCLSKDTKLDSNTREQRLMNMNQRVRLIEKFVQARNIINNDAGVAVNICQDLLTQHDIENAIRIGDIYAVLVSIYYTQSSPQEAWVIIEQMIQNNIDISSYLDENLLRDVCNVVQVPYDTIIKQQQQQQQHDMQQQQEEFNNEEILIQNNNDDIIDEEFVHTNNYDDDDDDDLGQYRAY